jgi:hypothetical protein
LESCERGVERREKIRGVEEETEERGEVEEEAERTKKRGAREEYASGGDFAELRTSGSREEEGKRRMNKPHGEEGKTKKNG